MLQKLDPVAKAAVAPSLWSLWCSGFTRRWHMNPALSWADDYICAHQGRCGMLVIALFPDHSLNLLRAAITHDAAESRVGDLSRLFKDAGGAVAAAHAALEAECLRDMGLDWDLTPLDQKRLKLVDVLDAQLFCILRAGPEAFSPEWLTALNGLYDKAHRLGVRARVVELVRDAQKRVTP